MVENILAVPRVPYEEGGNVTEGVRENVSYTKAGLNLVEHGALDKGDGYDT